MKWIMILSVSFLRPPFLVFLIVSPTKEKVAGEAFWNSSIKTSADCLLSDSIVSLDTKININTIIEDNDDDWWLELFDVVVSAFKCSSEWTELKVQPSLQLQLCKWTESFNLINSFKTFLSKSINWTLLIKKTVAKLDCRWSQQDTASQVTHT